jgi:hypothetical protein
MASAISLFLQSAGQAEMSAIEENKKYNDIEMACLTS